MEEQEQEQGGSVDRIELTEDTVQAVIEAAGALTDLLPIASDQDVKAFMFEVGEEGISVKVMFLDGSQEEFYGALPQQSEEGSDEGSSVASEE